MTRLYPPLADALSGQRHEINDPDCGRVSYYVDGPDAASSETSESRDATPLLLIHSINAAASAHEVKPLYDEYRTRRPTYAVDLPGYGHSERSDRAYLPRLMIQALHRVLEEIRTQHPGHPVDALAVSLSCEFLARLATEAPEIIRSIAIVSPTGFRKNTPVTAPPESNRGIPLARGIFQLPILGRGLYRALTTAPVVRFFLQKTWGSKQIDEEMFENSVRTCRAEGAHHAPFYFLSGYLFSADIVPVLESVNQPVWMTHGVRGDFTDYSMTRLFEHSPTWRIKRYQTGALPYFEELEQFIADYDAFLDSVKSGASINIASTASTGAAA